VQAAAGTDHSCSNSSSTISTFMVETPRTEVLVRADIPRGMLLYHTHAGFKPVIGVGFNVFNVRVACLEQQNNNVS
jgi:hypothetical protein